MKKAIARLTVLTLLCSPQGVLSFETDGRRWAIPETTFYIDIDGQAASGIFWNAAFKAAMEDWSEETAFTFRSVSEFSQPCFVDQRNGVDFTANVCGSDYGENTLAVTLTATSFNVLGPPTITETDIVFNQNQEFNIYDGNLVQFGIFGLDFRRVALHELGHALGLDHESGEPAIMAPTIGNLDRLQDDDIAGVEALYNHVSDCAFQALSFGSSTNALSEGDCTVDELYGGGSDTSPIDLYQFEVSTTTSFDFSMVSSSLDSILLLADENLQVVSFDNKDGSSCDSSLSQTLSPGSYVLMANTYTQVVNEQCALTGDYQLTASFTSGEPGTLGNAASLSGGPAFGVFSGGITANNGQSFGNLFGPEESLDVDASIQVDPLHVGQAGFLIVVAQIDEDLLLMDELGQFLLFDPDNPVLHRADSKLLEAVEDINILTDLVPADLGVTDVVVNFVVGYGLDSDPWEVFYHQLPLNLTVSSQSQ